MTVLAYCIILTNLKARCKVLCDQSKPISHKNANCNSPHLNTLVVTTHASRVELLVCPPVCPPVCWSICLSTCLSVCLSACPSVFLPVCPPVLSVCSSVCCCLSVHLSAAVCLFIFLSSVYLPVCLSVHLSVHSSVLKNIFVSGNSEAIKNCEDKEIASLCIPSRTQSSFIHCISMFSDY